MTQHVEFPQFELMGPRCSTEGCKGVLVDHLSLQSKDFYRKCSVCQQEFDRQPAQQKLDEAIETIESVLHCLGRYCTEKDPGLTCFCDCSACDASNERMLAWNKKENNQ